jgi:hemolysin activation/secretion protein
MRLTSVLLCLLSALSAGAGFSRAGEPAPAGGPAPAPASASYPLQQLLLADSVEAAQALQPDAAGGFVVLHGPLANANREELEKRLAAGKGQMISDQLLTAIIQVVTIFFRQQDLPVAEVIIPPQNIASGTVRLAVLRGKFRQIKFQGNRWFSESLLRETLKVQKGEIIRLSELDQAVSWVNTNPFRRVRVHIEPVAETGEADLTIGVEERIPLRLALSYDNTGNNILGFDRYTAAVTYGNVWGKDHQASYQFTTTHDPSLIQAHAFDYRIPLPWRHTLLVSASSARVEAPLFEGYFLQTGHSASADVKYVAPLKFKGWHAEVSGALSFKQSDNNLEFGDYSAFAALTDTFSASVGITAVRPDRRGRWVISGNLIGSPGDVNSRNTDATFSNSRYGARARFLYGQIWAQRITALAPSLSLMNRAIVQGGASTNLLPSEQFSLGGTASVRGYQERIYSGESGFMLNQELHKQLPARVLSKRLPPLESTLVAFWDYGRVYTHRLNPDVREVANATLQSFGFGVRFNLGRFLNATLRLRPAGQGSPDHRPSAGAACTRG